MDGNFDLLFENTLMAAYKSVQSTCIGQCAQCQRDSTGEEEFMFIAGDLHIAGMFNEKYCHGNKRMH